MLDERADREPDQPFDLADIAIGKVVHLWSGNLKDREIGEFHIVALNSNKALASEGLAMCCYSLNYDADCASGLIQVLSIRDLKENRVATLGLRFSVKGWRIDEFVGPHGEDVSAIAFTWIDENGKHNELDEPTDLHFLAQEVVRILNNNQRNDNDL